MSQVIIPLDRFLHVRHICSFPLLTRCLGLLSFRIFVNGDCSDLYLYPRHLYSIKQAYYFRRHRYCTPCNALFH